SATLCIDRMRAFSSRRTWMPEGSGWIPVTSRRSSGRGVTKRWASCGPIWAVIATPSEEPVAASLARHLLGEALEPHAVELTCRGMHRETWKNLLEVSAPLAGTAFRVSGHRDDQVGALEPDRVLARAEEEAFDDPRQLHVGRPVLGQVGEEAPEKRIV